MKTSYLRCNHNERQSLQLMTTYDKLMTTKKNKYLCLFG